MFNSASKDTELALAVVHPPSRRPAVREGAYRRKLDLHLLLLLDELLMERIISGEEHELELRLGRSLVQSAHLDESVLHPDNSPNSLPFDHLHDPVEP